jgi:hypothetical protein
MTREYKNKNRGYQQLRVWHDRVHELSSTALGSLGESVSGLEAYRRAEQINEADFKLLNELAYKLENGLLKLVESLERKKVTGDWIDTLIVKE